MQYTEGYDTEEIDDTNDLLDRKRLAGTIFKTITDTPNDWSIRLGVYGKWGDGKTTLLHYIKDIAQEKAYPFVYFRISIYSHPNELWAAFLISLLEGLHQQGYDIRNALTFSWLPNWSVEILPTKFLLKITSIAANINRSIHHDLANSALQLITNHLKLDSCFMNSMSKQLHGKKIIFAIDDFDRLSPELVPQFLTTLREILNLPYFAFVLAMDRDLTADAIKHRHPNHGTGHPFLEKIIDFPYTLPEPTEAQQKTLFENQLRKVVGINSKIDYTPIFPYLPKNPRKLKLVARNIKILKDEISRHSEDEIKWEVILFLCVLRSRSQHAYDVITKQLTNDDLYQIMFIDDKTQREDAINKKIGSIMKDCQDVIENDHELKDLLRYFFNNYYHFQSNNLHYFANLIVKPHFLTWKEFKELLKKYNEIKSTQPILDWIDTTQKSRNQKNRADITHELFDSSINYYADCLAKSADSELVTEHQRYTENAKQALGFIKVLFDSLEELREKEFLQFLDKMLAWQHFQINANDLKLRSEEITTVQELLTTLSRMSRLEIFYGLATRSDNLSTYPFGENNDRPKLDFVNKLLEKLTDVLDKLQSQLEKADEGWLAKSSNGNTALGYLLLNNDSILYKPDNINKLDDVVATANRNIHVYNNLKEFFNLFCEYTSQKRLNNNIANLAAPRLWKAATSRELQFRAHSALLKQRSLLIEEGVNENQLPLPMWLSTDN